MPITVSEKGMPRSNKLGCPSGYTIMRNRSSLPENGAMSRAYDRANSEPTARVEITVRKNSSSAGHNRRRRRRGRGGSMPSGNCGNCESKTSPGMGGSPLPSFMQVGCFGAQSSLHSGARSFAVYESHGSKRHSGFGSRSSGRERLEFFSRLEAHGFAGWNADLLSGARVAADAGLARLHVEHAEAAKF